MKTSDVFELIIQIENSVDTKVFLYENFNTWPIIRQILWFKLTAAPKNSCSNRVKQQSNSVRIVKRLISSWGKRLVSIKGNILQRNKDATKVFFSRPTYLQQLSNDQYFDRIIDPIILSLDKKIKILKFYVSSFQKNNLSISAYLLEPSFLFSKPKKLSINQQVVLQQVSDLSGINYEELAEKYAEDLNLFTRWFNAGIKVLTNKPSVNEIYLTSWYFPDMMGICAAASKLDIKTIDVQHGKQGKYQAMYSGWTTMPINGYDLMPDKFWCWGQPSCNHILAASPHRKNHIPFVGGYPWLSYYKKHLASSVDTMNYMAEKNILVTLQPPQGENIERIPDFIIGYLLSGYSKNCHFTFRLHPNDLSGGEYCHNRLNEVASERYNIDFGQGILYDAFIRSSHHITAYSSCCYEASAFGIPTLLFGSEAKDIYEDEIKEGRFSWLQGSVSELNKWLGASQKIKKNASFYIGVKK